MGFLNGRRAFIVGVATERSIAWGIAQAMRREGAELAFSYVNDKMKERVVPLAESIGSRLHMPLDVTVDGEIDAAYDLLKREWGGLDIVVHAVAYAPREALTGNFVASVERLLARFSLPPQCLEIELTENVLQTGPTTIDTLHALHTLGVSVALDDFGAGYSSLTSLEQLPLTRVKLDRGLVADVDVNPRAAAIARTIMTLCRSLGLQVTAEGVERLGQLEFLASCGDLTVQGYLVARPVPGPDALQFVADTHSRLAALRLIPGIKAGTAPSQRRPSGTVSVLRPRPRRR